MLFEYKIYIHKALKCCICWIYFLLQYYMDILRNEFVWPSFKYKEIPLGLSINIDLVNKSVTSALISINESTSFFSSKHFFGNQVMKKENCVICFQLTKNSPFSKIQLCFNECRRMLVGVYCHYMKISLRKMTACTSINV